MNKLLLIPFLLLFTGCMGLNASCGHIVGSGAYATAQGSGAAFHCNVGCAGWGCPKAVDYSAVTALATTYVNSSSMVTTVMPVTIGVTPIAAPVTNQTTGVVQTPAK